MTMLIVSDLHLTDNIHDEYRWGLFPWLKEQIQKYRVNHLLILGDLTDKKDLHSSFLANRICDTLVDLSKSAGVILLKGNHDFIDENTPFFKFINNLELPTLKFIIQPTGLFIDDKKCLFLPCTRKNHKEVWNNFDFHKYDFIFCHETFKGAISETGISLDGISHSIFDNSDATIISGDIHVAQELGPITYCGSPYRIRFGDRFNGRCILIDNNGKRKDLKFPCMKKHTIELFDYLDDSWLKEVSKGDQIKFRLSLPRAEIHDWEKYKQSLLDVAKKHNLTVHGIELKVIDKSNEKSKAHQKKASSPKDYFEAFCKREKITGVEKQLGEILL